MPTWMLLAKGPAFLFVLTVLLLGLLRLIILTTWDILAAIRQAGDQRFPYRQIALQTVAWLLPFNRLHRNRAGYSTASFTLHLGILIVSLFLRNHLDILQANIGFSWMAISKPILDVLTLVGILGISFLLLFRLYVASSRRLSRGRRLPALAHAPEHLCVRLPGGKALEPDSLRWPDALPYLEWHGLTFAYPVHQSCTLCTLSAYSPGNRGSLAFHAPGW